MLVKNGSRKRTLGGIFFHLVRNGINETASRALFPPWAWRSREVIPPAPDPLEGPQDWLEDILTTAQEVQSVDVTLVGRPGKSIEQNGVVIVSVKRTQQLTPPRGLPPLPAGHGQYLCFITKRQWERLGELGPEDELIIKGYGTLHPKFSKGIVVYVESIMKKDQARQQVQKSRKQRDLVPA